MTFQTANVFDLLPQIPSGAKDGYDLIVLDPPAFTKSRQTVEHAMVPATAKSNGVICLINGETLEELAQTTTISAIFENGASFGESLCFILPPEN